MSKGRLIAKRGDYEIRQYGSWVRGWIDADGEYHEERGESPLDLTQELLAQLMEDLWIATLDAPQQT